MTNLIKAIPSKQWIAFEGSRNRSNAQLIARLVTVAYGQAYKMFIGHHLAYKTDDAAIVTLSEIPSMDTLLFDHPIMQANFGPRYLDVMAQLARTPCDQREAVLEQMLADYAAGTLPELLCAYSIVHDEAIAVGGQPIVMA